MRGNILSIQIGRAVAATLVLFAHLSFTYGQILPPGVGFDIPGFLYFGYSGVDLFFVVSGYIISHIIAGRFHLQDFVLRRVIRILPFYMFFTAVFVSARAAFGKSFNLDVSYVLRSILALPLQEAPALGVGWTLEHEFIFYFLVAVVLTLAGRAVLMPALAGLFAAGVAVHVLLPASTGVQVWDLHAFSLFQFQFLVGVFIYQGQKRLRSIGIAAPILIGVLGVCLTAAYLSVPNGSTDRVSIYPIGLDGLIRVVGYGVSWGFVVSGLLNAEPALRRAHAAGSKAVFMLCLIGDASFALYLSHPLVLLAFGRLYRKLDIGLALLDPALALALLAAVASAVVFLLLVERPFLRFSHTALPILLPHTSPMASKTS